jgi:hypothetical protein
MSGMSSDDMLKASQQAKGMSGTLKAQQEYNYNVRLAPLPGGPLPHACLSRSPWHSRRLSASSAGGAVRLD